MAKILAVDDERVLVKAIKFNLEQEGYQVEVSYDGEKAVELARQGDFDLILLDLMMPKLDGLQVCRQIRAFSDVPIIMLTALGEDADKLAGFACGADDYITKPFKILELKARIRALLRRSGITRHEHQGKNLLNVVWGYEYIGDYRTVDVHIRRLREKLELDPAKPQYIATKWGVGYYLSPGGEAKG